MPFIWDYDLWAALCQLAIVLIGACGSYLGQTPTLGGPDWLVRSAAPAVRNTIIVLYLATVFWKFTTSFFGTQSCAPIFTLSLLDLVLPELDETSPLLQQLVWVTAAAAPYLTVFIEALIPLLLWLAPWPFGVLVGVFFHFLIAITPPPNNASIFSVCCIVNFFFFAPEPIAAAAQRAPTKLLAACSSVAVGAAIRLGVRHGSDWGAATTVVMGCFYLHAAMCPAPQTQQAAGRRAHPVVGRITWLMVVLTLGYGVALPALGLQDMGASTMFANLHVYSGSNHLVAPTGLLFDHLPVLAGGVVRVDATNSVHFNSINPHEVSTMHSPRLKQWLSSVGHSGRQFAPYGARVMGSFAPRPGPADLPAAEKVFTPYLLPMVELRRLVNEAGAKGESFELQYTKLGLPPLDAAKALATRGRFERGRVTPQDVLSAKFKDNMLNNCAGCDGSFIKCTDSFVLCECTDSAGTRCSGEDVELLTKPLPAWAFKTLAFFSFPVAPSGGTFEELGCIC